MKILPATLTDWPEIEQIYREGIRTKLATFETEDNIPTGEAWFAGKVDNLIFKAVDDDGKMLGWVTCSAVSNRCVYAGVAEVSVYVADAAKGQGIGTALLEQLITTSEDAGIWTLQAGIFADNHASIKLHHKVGFRTLGIREKLGKLDGEWRDVAFLERRSPNIL